MYNKAFKSPGEVDDLLRTIGDASREQTLSELRGLNALRGGAEAPAKGFFSGIFGGSSAPTESVPGQLVYPWDMHHLRDIK